MGDNKVGNIHNNTEGNTVHKQVNTRIAQLVLTEQLPWLWLIEPEDSWFLYFLQYNLDLLCFQHPKL